MFSSLVHGLVLVDLAAHQVEAGGAGLGADVDIAARKAMFKPQQNVTGYEALAMILRAIGYDRNNESRVVWPAGRGVAAVRLACSFAMTTPSIFSILKVL